MSIVWKLIAKILAVPRIADCLISLAMKTPYYPIVKDGQPYMERFWLLNPYESVDGQQMGSRFKCSHGMFGSIGFGCRIKTGICMTIRGMPGR